MSLDTQAFFSKNKAKLHIVKHQKITVNHKNRDLKLMILILFCIWEDVRVWAYLNYSFNTHPNYLGPISSFPPSHFPSGSTVQGICGGLMALRLKYPMFITNYKSTYENITSMLFNRYIDCFIRCVSLFFLVRCVEDIHNFYQSKIIWNRIIICFFVFLYPGFINAKHIILFLNKF